MAFLLNISIIPEGAGSVQLSPWGDYVSPGVISYPDNTNVNLTALPVVYGSYFIQWGGDAVGTSPITVVTMNSDKMVTATFGIEEGPVETAQLTTEVVGAGQVFPSEGVYNLDDQIVIVAYPEDDNILKSWSGGGVPVPEMPNHILVTMDQDRHIIFLFESTIEPEPPSFPLAPWLLAGALIGTIGIVIYSRKSSPRGG